MYATNVLSIDDEQLIYGVYHTLQGEFSFIIFVLVHMLITTFTLAGSNNDAANASWWPKQSTWNSSDADVGYWSSLDEKWFHEHLGRICGRKAKLIKAMGWKDLLKFQKADT